MRDQKKLGDKKRDGKKMGIQDTRQKKGRLDAR